MNFGVSAFAFFVPQRRISTLRIVAWRERGAAASISDELGDGGHAKLFHEMGAMRLDRAGADGQLRRDLTAGLSLNNERKDLPFAHRQDLVGI